MDKAYADTLRLLLTAAPDVFAGEVFAMKGGTAINLFVREMPRLSIDIDVAYVPWQVPRERALPAISAELAAISERLTRRGMGVRTIDGGDTGDTRLFIESDSSQIKVEVNPVFRGTVLPVEARRLVKTTAAMFSAELALPVLATAELYGSKLVAAMDRQHPRDLFDAWQMFEIEGLSDDIVECFVTYLAGHNRPIHEVLFPVPKDITREFQTTFVGMTAEPVALETLLSARSRLLEELPRRLTDKQRGFLLGLVRAEPDWTLLRCPHASELPALRWKLANLVAFKQKRPTDFNRQVEILTAKLHG